MRPFAARPLGEPAVRYGPLQCAPATRSSKPSPTTEISNSSARKNIAASRAAFCETYLAGSQIGAKPAMGGSRSGFKLKSPVGRVPLVIF